MGVPLEASLSNKRRGQHQCCKAVPPEKGQALEASASDDTRHPYHDAAPPETGLALGALVSDNMTHCQHGCRIAAPRKKGLALGASGGDGIWKVQDQGVGGWAVLGQVHPGSIHSVGVTGLVCSHS